MLRAALVDVGGTLWPDRGPPGEAQCRVRQLHALLPQLTREQASLLADALNAPALKWERDGALAQNTDAIVEEVLLERGIREADTVSIRRAMCIPASKGIHLFNGAPQLLRLIHDLGWRTVVVSNTAWRDAESYRSDFDYCGVGAHIDVIVTSLDVKFRKPHEEIFRVAIGAAGCSARECVVVGDSEERDIAPAIQRGMRSL
ncbi:MAG: HAD family hydrolase, partial [Actinomycetota bacterium]